MNNQKKMGNKGFSLVELIVVIAIMAVLVGVLAPQFLRYVEKSRQSGDMTSVQELMTAVETAVSDGTIGSGSVTITITGGDTATAVVTDAGTALSDSGLSNTANLKSKGWGNMTIVYSTSDFKWTLNGSGANSKKPNLDMSAVTNGVAASK